MAVRIEFFCDLSSEYSVELLSSISSTRLITKVAINYKVVQSKVIAASASYSSSFKCVFCNTTMV